MLEQFRDNATNFRREVLVLALQLFNKCIGFTRNSGRLRNLVWNKSSEMSRSPGGGGLSLIQSLVSLCDPVQVEARLSKHL